MKIELKIENKDLLLKSKRGEKKLAYATVNALNETAKQLQKRVQVSAQKDLHIRKPFALRQTAMIKPFASVKQGRAFTEISVGQKDRLLLPELASVENEKRKPFTQGAKRAAVPIVSGRPRAQFPGPFPQDLLFRKLQLKKWPRGKGKKARARYPGEPEGKQTIWRGKNRTFMIPSIGVFQRYGSARGETKPIYIFDQDVPIPNRLEFLDIMERYAGADLQEQMERQIIKEIQHGL